jgi:hypothetical protein
VNLGAPFAGFVVAAGFFVGAGVTCLPGGAAVAAPVADSGRGVAWVVGCFVAESYCMLDADLGGVTKGVGLHVCT